MNVNCPICPISNASIVISKGVNNTCSVCGSEWFISELTIESNKDHLPEFKHCPCCGSNGKRLLYGCNECGLIGCHGCNPGINEKDHCPHCDISPVKIIAFVDKELDS